MGVGTEDIGGGMGAGMAVIMVIAAVVVVGMVAVMVVGMEVNGGMDTTVDGMEVVDITTTGTSA
jgi:hypothetical protein